jgi:hypothetical protein
MIRAVLEEAAIFALPFVLFALYLVIRRRNPLLWSHWSTSSYWLLIAGLLAAIGGFVASGLLAERRTTPFEPTHVEDGRLVPGRFR